jgi:hypothetical protein
MSPKPFIPTRVARWTAAMLFGAVVLSVAASNGGGHAMSNQIHVIAPYRQASTWVFDDPAVGLKGEPFVSGIPEMIDTLVKDMPQVRPS